jgi:hypothetical protein
LAPDCPRSKSSPGMSSHTVTLLSPLPIIHPALSEHAPPTAGWMTFQSRLWTALSAVIAALVDCVVHRHLPARLRRWLDCAVSGSVILEVARHAVFCLYRTDPLGGPDCVRIRKRIEEPFGWIKTIGGAASCATSADNATGRVQNHRRLQPDPHRRPRHTTLPPRSARTRQFETGQPRAGTIHLHATTVTDRLQARAFRTLVDGQAGLDVGDHRFCVPQWSRVRVK